MTTSYDIKQLKDISLFPVIVRENMRFRDLDGNGHVNNAVYATYLELARGRTRRKCLAPRPPGTGSVVGRQSIHYFRQLNYPGVLDIATAIVQITRSTWTWGHGVFKEGVCYASGEVTMVIIDKSTRRAGEIPQQFRDSLEALHLCQTDSPLIITSDV
jgi:acyl-CoA thioester hydrolase